MPKITIAVAQAHSHPSLQSTLSALSRITHHASTRGAHLLLFPEAYLNLNTSAETIDETLSTLSKIAHENSIFLITGLKHQNENKNEIVYIDPQHGCISTRQALPGGNPSSLRAVTATLNGCTVTLASALGVENSSPLLRQAIYAQQVDLYLALAERACGPWVSVMRTVGFESGVFVVAAVQCLRYGDLKPGTGSGLESGIGWRGCLEDFVSPGGSCIVGCQGQVLAGPLWEVSADDAPDSVVTAEAAGDGSAVGDGLLVAEVDLEDCVRARDDAGCRLRGDAFRLTVEGLDLPPS